MPKGLRKFVFSLDGDGLTRYGGLVLFQAFCKSIALRRFLQTYVRWPRYDYLKFHPADIFLTHVYAIVAGIGRIENTQSLISNGLLPSLLGLPIFPHRKTLRDFLHRFGPEHLRSLQVAHDKFRDWLFPTLGLQYSAIIDADTTTLTVFGGQEGTAVGFNRKYRGKSSYAPIISSEGRMGLSLGMDLLAGNVHPSPGAWLFLKQMLEKLPSTIATSRTRVRLDGAFYDKDLIFPLERARIGYCVVAKMTAPLKRVMVRARYNEFAEGWESAEFLYTPFHWETAHRFVAVRRPSALESERVQASLFPFQNYTYHRVLVHALDLEPHNVWRFYCDRGFQELLLREFKDSYTLSRIPTRRFLANAAYMEIILWAYDLVRAFQFLCLPEEFQHWNISTLRRELWSIPAEWVRTDNRNCLRLPRLFPNHDLFQKVYKASLKASPLI